VTSRARTTIGLSVALLIGLIGPSMVAVARHSGSGSGSISGTIFTDGQSRGSGCISAWFSRARAPIRVPIDEFRDPDDEMYAGSTHPTSWYAGNYRLGNLAPDTYKIEFHDCASHRVDTSRIVLPGQYESRFWPDAPNYEDAGEIVLGPGEAVTGIDGSIWRR
jgi:hypothetical protein